MIQAIFEIDKDSGALIMSMEGHAGSDLPGKDLICCSASVLAYTLAQNLDVIYKLKRLKKKPKTKFNSGDIEIVAKPTKEARSEVLHTFAVIEIGVMMLAAEYPEYIQIKPFDLAKDNKGPEPVNK